MLLHLDKADPTPLYKQIAQQIRERILSGELPPGTELPSIRQLAAQLLTSVITTKRAYLELETEGMIVTRPGIGSVVATFSPTDRNALRLQEVREQLADVVEGARRLGVHDETLRKLFDDVMREGEGGTGE